MSVARLLAQLFPMIALSVATANAQATTATGTIPARARVGSTITLSNPTEIDFGTLQPGGTSANVPASFASSVPHAGSIQVDYSDGMITVNTTIDSGDELALDAASPTLTANLSCALGSSATATNTSQIGCTGQNFNATSGTATVFLFVGGQASAPANAKSGVYTGKVTVRISLTSQ
jgi:hypothetical protein